MLLLPRECDDSQIIPTATAKELCGLTVKEITFSRSENIIAHTMYARLSLQLT